MPDVHFKIANYIENLGLLGPSDSVFKAKHAGTPTVVKLLPFFIENEQEPEYAIFVNEVRKLKELNENNIRVPEVVSFGLSLDGFHPFIEYKFIDGQQIGDSGEGHVEQAWAAEKLIQLAEEVSRILAFCHNADIKHGAIKKSSIKYNPKTDNYFLLNFGFALLPQNVRIEELKKQKGGFPAPEQIKGEIFYQTDIYQFGKILLSLLTGKSNLSHSSTPHQSPASENLEISYLLSLRAKALPSVSLNDQKEKELEVPQWLISTIQKCVQAKPENRFSNGLELYNHILTNNKTLLLKKNWYRSEPQQKKIIANKPLYKDAVKKIHAPATAVITKTPVKEKPVVIKEVSKRKVQPQTYERSVDLKPKKNYTSLYISLIIVALLCIAAGYFFSHYQTVNKNPVSAPPLISPADSFFQQENGIGLHKIDEERNIKKDLRKSKLKDKSSMEDPVIISKSAVTNTLKKSSGETSQSKTLNMNVGLGKYKVRSKAHFYNAPDEAAKRDAFIVHWNNAVLHPIKEENNFIYIVFTNFKGQTSKGWLRKKDIIEAE